ncbi:UNVERIFIED_CONTAM: hypothetical protein HDU68_000988, partial [Siphonaria sp. JEL0065]
MNYLQPVSFTTALVLMSFTGIATMKSVMFFQTDKSEYRMYGLFHFPGIFFLDAIVCGCLMVRQRARIRRSAITVVALVIQTLIASIAFGYFLKTKNHMDWFVFEDLDLDRAITYARSFKGELLFIGILFALFLVIQGYAAFWLFKKSHSHSPTPRRFDSYLPIKFDESPGSSEIEEDKPLLPKVPRKKIFLVWYSFQLLFSYVFVIKRGTDMARLSENYLISPPLTYALRSYKNWRKPVPSATYSASTFDDEDQAKSLYAGPKLDNVVILFLESMRSDIIDFTPDSFLAQLLLNPDHVQNFDKHIFPIVNKLKKRSLHVPNARTSAA